MSVADWNREQHERAVASGEWWTSEHQALALRLMRELRDRKIAIRLMPADRDQDVIQDVLLTYRKRIRTWDGRNYTAWLRTNLYRRAVDVLRKEFHLRAKNPLQFVPLDEVVVAETAFEVADDEE